MEFPTYEELGRKLADRALDEVDYKGKTLREWIEIIVNQESVKIGCTLEDFKQFALENNYALLTTELYSQMITEREWISPKDKLPDDMTRVLVTIKTRSRIAVRSGTYYDGHFSLDNGDCWLTRDKEVRGWMKCPKPYERGAEWQINDYIQTQ